MTYTLLGNIDKRLTRLTVIGDPSFQEGIASIRDFYENDPTPNVLWDFRKASLAHISSEQFEEMVNVVMPYAEKCPGGKTALIAFKDLELAMSRMIQIFDELKNSPINIRIFQTIEDAMKWFDGEEE